MLRDHECDLAFSFETETQRGTIDNEVSFRQMSHGCQMSHLSPFAPHKGLSGTVQCLMLVQPL